MGFVSAHAKIYDADIRDEEIFFLIRAASQMAQRLLTFCRRYDTISFRYRDVGDLFDDAFLCRRRRAFPARAKVADCRQEMRC